MTGVAGEGLAPGEPGPAALPLPAWVGPYRIEGELGRGGMGVVHLGRDPRLGREVALKSLPAEFAADPAWIERFTREAMALASLHHPGIGTIHGLQVGPGGTPFLILERAHGETLAHRLERGSLPLPELLDVCGQIAAALEAAHQRGIVHRDLKPGNVMISPWGRVKVLDFGVAQRLDDIAAPSLAAAPGGAGPGGQDGGERAPAGTPGYMSPEQILGTAQDGRSDVFALGCILYEGLTGQPAFPGRTVEEILAATLAGAPGLERLSEAPEPLRTLTARCLEKDPTRRPAGMGEVAAALARGDAGHPGEPTAGPETGAAVPHNLPPERDPFIGRAGERQRLADLVRRARAVTVTGAGGCGKTRLALRVARDLLAEHADGVWFADLAPIADPGRVAEAVAQAAGARAEAGRGLLASLIDRLAGRRCLLVLDNCEHQVAASTALVGPLLEACPGLRVLATSRDWLGLRGEESVRLAPMEVPAGSDGGEPETLAGVESVRLFVERARRRRPGFRLDAQNAPRVAQLCRALEGIPLAIELAAAQEGAMAPEVLPQPRAGTPGSAAPARLTAPDLHPTLEATIRWSYDRLHDEERVGLRALSVFAGGCALEAAAAVLGLEEFAALDVLTRLVDRSLLTVTPGRRESRYRPLESVRSFAAEALRAAGEAARHADRHARYFLGLAERAEPELTGPAQSEWLARLDPDHDNLLAAIATRLEGDRVQEGARLAAALYRFWFTRGHYQTGRRILARAIACDRHGPPTPARAKMLWGAGNLAVFQGEPEAAHPLFEASLAAYRALGDTPGTARALNGLGLAAQDQGHYATARGFFERSLELFRAIGEPRGTGAVLDNLAVLALYQRDFATAERLLRQAVDLAREGGASDALTQHLADLGLTLVRSGRWEEARAPLRECLDLGLRLEARRSAAGALEAAAEIALRAGDARRAARGYGAAAALRAAIGLPPEPYEREARAGVLEAIRAALGAAEDDEARAGGAALGFERSVLEARRALDDPAA